MEKQIMNFEMFSALDEEIIKEDWERTPASIQRLLRWLLESYEARLADLEESKLISQLETQQSSEGHAEAQVAASTKLKESGCSFCGKKQEEVSRLIAGRNVYICDECIDICHAIMEDGAS